MNPISLVFHDGIFQKKASTNETLAPNVECRISENEIYLRFPKMFELNVPVHFIFMGTKNYGLQKTIILEENSKVHFIEEYVQNTEVPYAVNATTHISLEKNASLDFYKLQKEGVEASHKSSVVIEQHESSQLQMFIADSGSLTALHDVNVKLKEKYATCALHGLYLLDQPQQNIQHTVLVDHLAPHGQSAMYYKGMLDKTSTASFAGRVKVHPHAIKVKASQENHHLLLSKNAEANSKPELEIYADDIQCTHGSTVGQLDPAALFYLRSRGMDEQHAKSFLQQAFCTQVLAQIQHADIREYVQQRVGLHEL